MWQRRRRGGWHCWREGGGGSAGWDLLAGGMWQERTAGPARAGEPDYLSEGLSDPLSAGDQGMNAVIDRRRIIPGSTATFVAKLRLDRHVS